MAWVPWRSAHRSTAEERTAACESETIAAIFTPSHTAASPTSVSSVRTAARPSPPVETGSAAKKWSLVKWWSTPTTAPTSGRSCDTNAWGLDAKTEMADTSTHRRGDGARSFTALGQSLSERTAQSSDQGTDSSPLPRRSATPLVVATEDFPPCPIGGFTLTRAGLLDVQESPPRILSLPELRGVVAELASIEQRAKYDVDAQLGDQVDGRARRGMEFAVNPALHMCGLYLMFWKAPRLYAAALPRESVLLTRVVGWLSTTISSSTAESFAQRHRRLLQATNARVTMAFLAGCAVESIALYTQPPLDVLTAGQDVAIGKQAVGYQQHTEAALKWLWYVYYHHPAYASDAQRAAGHSGV